MAYAYQLALPAALGSDLHSLFPTFRRFLASVHDHLIPHERNNYHPHILGHRFLGLFSLMMIALKFSMVAAVAISPAASTYASAINGTNVISLSNESRAQYSLPVLTENSVLNRAAQAKANDMLAKGYFAHNTPDGKTPWTFIKAAGYSYITAGENLAVDFTEAETVQTAWMNSPGHRANILNKNYEEIGVGVSQGTWQGHQTTFVVQMFGTPVGQKVALSDTPTPVAPALSPATAKTVSAPPVVITKPVAVTKSVSKPAAVVVPAAPKPITANSTPAPIATPAPPTFSASLADLAPAKITDVQTAINGNDLTLNVNTNDTTANVIANYNDKGIMLAPRGPGVWQGSIPLSSLSGEVALAVNATDMAGHNDQQSVASFSPSQQDNYGIQGQGQVKGASINLFGTTIDRHAFEQKFFLLVITGLLASLILAIAIKRHIQHLSLIANGSFVAILATLLWISG